MKVVWAIICQKSIIDRDTNNVTLFNVIEEIIIPTNPPILEGPIPASPGLITPSVFELIVLWTRSDSNASETGRSRLQMLTPNGTPMITPIEGEVDLTKFKRLRQRITFPGLPYLEIDMQQGEHIIKIEKSHTRGEWEQAYELPFDITIQDDEP